MKNKKAIVPNECSLKRWICTALVALLLGVVFSIPAEALFVSKPELLDVSFMGIPIMVIYLVASFSFLFLGAVAAIKWVAKTPLKDFILGYGGKLDKREVGIFIALHLTGIAISLLLSLPNIHLRGTETGTLLALILIILVFTWMQTTWEELVFRGIFLRWACKNNIGYTRKAIFAMFLSSAIFGLVHASNPEISSMSGIELLLGIICYILPGLVFFWADIQFKSLVPGIILHWVNNFIAFTVVAAEVSAVPVPTLLVDKSEATAPMLFFATLLVLLPTMLYTLYNMIKSRKQQIPRV